MPIQGTLCRVCSTETKSVYHYEGCPSDKSGVHLWLKDSERPIEKADRFQKMMGEREGAEGWI
jgi:hypothetical protein